MRRVITFTTPDTNPQVLVVSMQMFRGQPMSEMSAATLDRTLEHLKEGPLEYDAAQEEFALRFQQDLPEQIVLTPGRALSMVQPGDSLLIVECLHLPAGVHSSSQMYSFHLLKSTFVTDEPYHMDSWEGLSDDEYDTWCQSRDALQQYASSLMSASAHGAAERLRLCLELASHYVILVRSDSSVASSDIDIDHLSTWDKDAQELLFLVADQNTRGDFVVATQLRMAVTLANRTARRYKPS